MTNTIERVSELSTFNEPELLRGSMYQYENQAHTFVIECTQDGQHVDLQGDITARFMRADRNTVYLAPVAQDPDQEAVANDLTTIDSQGRAVVTLHRDCYNVPGRFQLAIYNVNGGRTVCIYACVSAIRLTQAGALIDSGEAFDPASFSDDIAALGTLIQQTNAAKDAANAAAASVAGDVADLKSAVNSITDGMIFTLTENDIAAYVASKDHGTYAEGQIVTVGTANYHVRIIRVRKGQWIKASLGNAKTINVMSYVQQDGTFIETIVQGGCYKFKYQVDRDGYIALCTNITSARNEVVLYSDSPDHFNEEYEIGWKNGYTIYNGTIDQMTHDFIYDAAYGLSNPIYLRFGDKLTVSSLASSSVAVFCTYNEETGVWSKNKQGASGSTYNEYSMTASSVCRVYISHKFALADDEFSILINRNHHTITSDYQTNDGVAFTSINQYTKPGMYYITDNLTDRPYNESGSLLVVQHNTVYVTQYYYIYSLQKLMVRLLGVNGTPYNEWMELEQIDPEKNTFIGNRTGNKYVDLTSSFTSIDQFVKAPFFGQLYNTSITDLPMNRNGVLEVIPANATYVLQRYYIYSRNLVLQRFLHVNGTPYNEWIALGEPLYGKKIIGVGDSLMAGNQIGNSYTWLNLLGSQYGAITYNYGQNGNPVANIGDTVGMVGRVPNIYNTDGITETDYFVLIGGANDKRLSVPIGDVDSTNIIEFCGALNSIISFVRQYWPKAHMVFLTNYDRSPTLNSLGKTDIDYVEAMQRVCAKRHVFCYDNYHDSGVDFHDEHFIAWADEGIYRDTSANAHFSPEGYKWLLPKYKALLEAN